MNTGLVNAEMRRAVACLLRGIGEDPTREGLLNTPDRVVRALQEMNAGRLLDPRRHLKTQFKCKTDSMVILKGIRFTSTCEHHLLPFQGTAAVGYIPAKNKVVGLSKLARVVTEYANRLQLQEQLAEQIASALADTLHPKGIAVHLVASHSCLGCRGAHQPDAEMVTTVVRGLMKRSATARAEFMESIR